MPTSHAATCTLCEAICGILVETDAGRVVSIRGDHDDPFSRGHICPKAVALADLQDDPDRLRRPVRREGSSWREVDWDTAVEDVSRRLRAVQRAHGRDAVAVYLGNPTVHSLGAMLFTPPFVRSLRTRHRYSATSVDQLPHMVAAAHMFGHQFLLPIPDVDRTQHLLVFGANPAVSNGSLMTAPGIVKRLKDLRARGGRLVIIDPRRTETAALADEHHFIRPGSDALLLLAMLNVLYTEARVRPGACAPFVEGLDTLGAAASRFPPERVSATTGLTAETIRRLARDFVDAERAVGYGRVGVSVQEFGGVACWLINALNIVTGRLDTPGGAMFTAPAVDLIRGGYAGHGRSGRWRSRVRGLAEFGGELPAAALAEEIDTPGTGQIRALVTSAGNPVLSTPNGGRLERALPGLEFMVSIDIYVNETTRHAHYILPPTAPLERDHYDLIFHALAVRNTAKFSPAVLPPPADARHEWQILNELTWRLEDERTWSRVRARGAAGLRALLGPRRMLDLALRRGPRRLSLRRLRQAPHGLDLGPLEPCLPARLRTADKRIALAPAAFVSDVARLERALEAPAAPAGAQLLLISRRELRSNNSWMHNSLRLVKGRRRCTLLMHPDDAHVRGLADGTQVTVRSRVGSMTVELQVSDEIAPGVVCLPHGWGHGRDGIRLHVAAAHPGASVNDLTDDQAIDPLTGNAAFSGVPVTVET